MAPLIPLAVLASLGVLVLSKKSSTDASQGALGKASDAGSNQDILSKILNPASNKDASMGLAASDYYTLQSDGFYVLAPSGLDRVSGALDRGGYLGKPNEYDDWEFNPPHPNQDHQGLRFNEFQKRNAPENGTDALLFDRTPVDRILENGAVPNGDRVIVGVVARANLPSIPAAVRPTLVIY